MSRLLRVMVNGDTVLEYNCDNRLPGHQRRFLDKMDADMDRGISLAGESVVDPDKSQRVSYVAMTLVRAYLDGNENLKLASCAWLGDRSPELREIVANQEGDSISMQLRTS